MTLSDKKADQILIVNTGGTIGMKRGPDGLEPDEGRIEAALAGLIGQALPMRIARFDPLLDSAHLNHKHWNRIIDLVVSWPGSGVVVTHGTDTMAYTGAALAFGLAGLDRRVVLCGAMRPLGTDGDAERNLLLALSAAADGPSGVWLASGGRLLAGHALVKHHSNSPNPFVEAEGAEAPEPRNHGAHCFADRRLAILTVSPGLPAPALRAMLGELDGAILRVYGSGTAPADSEFVAALAEAVAGGKRILAVSQCEAGGLRPGTYASGAPLWSVGVESGGRKTPEAALLSLWLDLSPEVPMLSPTALGRR